MTVRMTRRSTHEVMANSVRVFAEKCVDGLEPDVTRCRELVDRSLMLVTALNPLIGYDAAAAVAKEAHATGRTLREILLERKLLDPATLERVLEPLAMTRPGASGLSASGG